MIDQAPAAGGAIRIPPWAKFRSFCHGLRRKSPSMILPGSGERNHGDSPAIYRLILTMGINFDTTIGTTYLWG